MSDREIAPELSWALSAISDTLDAACADPHLIGMQDEETPSDNTRDHRLIRLADHEAPPLPTEEWLRQHWSQLRALVAHGNDRPFIADDKLERATLSMLDKVVAPPACGPVIDELSATIGARQAEGLSSTRLTLIVVPPCDENDVVGTWGNENGLRTASAPPRDALLRHAPPLDLNGEGLLVVPQLERWFLRHVVGLSAVRSLLHALDRTERRCVVGCSSWTWAFLSHAVQADLILPEPLTFEPFDAGRLKDWFADLSGAGDGKMNFRLGGSGDFLLSGTSSQRDDFFAKLAALSRGIPWVAWHLWRQALRSNEDDEVPTADDHEKQQTLWVAALNELVLPGHHPQVALLVLHALLIHGSLSRDEIDRVLPDEGRGAILASLVHSGFVELTTTH